MFGEKYKFHKKQKASKLYKQEWENFTLKIVPKLFAYSD
jgi:hypothetical protein